MPQPGARGAGDDDPLPGDRLNLRLFLALALAVLIATDAAAQLAVKKSHVKGVTVSVLPLNIGQDQQTWDFAVMVDGHFRVLSDDLTGKAVLRDDRGREYGALAWEGGAPSRHLAGVLKFRAIDPMPKAIELRIMRPEEGRPRAFRWRLAMNEKRRLGP